MSDAAARSAILSRLRESGTPSRTRPTKALAFGIAQMDVYLASNGLDGDSLHEIVPASAAPSDDAAATLFMTGVAARFSSAASARVLWAVTNFDLYAPAIEQAGLPPNRVIFAEAREDNEVLALMEDGLRHGALAAVIGEVKRADMTATRRLQLAAAAGNTPALLSRRWRRRGDTCPLAELSAATTRWRIACAPSQQLPAPGVGRARWSVELVRQRNGPPFSLIVEACDDTGRLGLPSGAVDRAVCEDGATARAA